MEKSKTELLNGNEELIEAGCSSNIQRNESTLNENRKRKNCSDNESTKDESMFNIKKQRYNNNFWKGSIKNDENKCKEIIQIRNLKIGKNVKEILKVRITYKSYVRESPSGFVFNFYGMDDTSEISFTNFGNDCSRFYEALTINSVCTLENYYIEKENPSYPSYTGHMLQVKLNPSTKIIEIKEEKDFPEIKFKFILLEHFEGISINEKVDVLGILIEDYGQDKNHRNNSMRDLAITDKSKGDVIATIWGKEAENFVCEKYSVVIIRNGIVTSFEGIKKINCLYGCLVWCNPNTMEALDLKNWFKEEIKTISCDSV